jgi:hypothetical protein
MLRTSAAMSNRSRRYSDYALTISTSSQVRLARNPLPDSPSEAMYVQMSIRSSSARVVRTIRILSRRRKPAPRLRFYLINRHGKPRRAVDPLPRKTPKLLDSDHLRYTLDAPFRDCLEHRSLSGAYSSRWTADPTSAARSSGKETSNVSLHAPFKTYLISCLVVKSGFRDRVWAKKLAKAAFPRKIHYSRSRRKTRAPASRAPAVR